MTAEQAAMRRADTRLRTPSDPRLGLVLVIGDDAAATAQIVEAVQGAGLRALPVRQSDAALELARSERPLLILRDAAMGDLPASAFVGALRHDRASQGIPLVFYGTSAAPSPYAPWGAVAGIPEATEIEALVARITRQPGPVLPGASGRSLHAEARDAFRELVDLLAALHNYAQLLERRGRADEARVQAIEGIEKAVLKLEAMVARMRAYVLSLVDTLEPHEERPPSGRGRRR